MSEGSGNCYITGKKIQERPRNRQHRICLLTKKKETIKTEKLIREQKANISEVLSQGNWKYGGNIYKEKIRQGDGWKT